LAVDIGLSRLQIGFGEQAMPISEQVIIDSVARYDRERDRYLKLASRVADICRTSIVEGNAVRAQITSRTKTVRSFEGKLRRFAKRADKNFTTVDEVFERIGDFAGVRVATYRPEDEPRVAEAVRSLFTGSDGSDVHVDLKDKLDPANCQFYRATHCQVFLRADEMIGDYANLRGASCEIQICSMMAHVWNEIEHDIGYKPEGGGPGDAERGLLEVLGHLTRSGDAAITQLLAANFSRLRAQTGDFSDVHDFAARLRRYFPDADLTVNAGPIFDEVMLLGLTSLERLETALGPGAFDVHAATARIAKFNKFLEASGSPELALNPGSADLLLLSLLARFCDRIQENHPPGRLKSRPSKISVLAKRYREFENTDAGDRDAA
jgi:ppGpp synthetase/RelA/SpoT-type nucleotidyltranferase